MQMSITPEEIIFVGLFVQIKSITVLEFSREREEEAALNASNHSGRRSPSYFTALPDINNLET